MCQKKLADAQAKERKDETAADSATTNLENSERASVKSSEEVTRLRTALSTQRLFISSIVKSCISLEFVCNVVWAGSVWNVTVVVDVSLSQLVSSLWGVHQVI